MKTVTTPEFISFSLFFFNLSIPLRFKQKLLFGLVKSFFWLSEKKAQRLSHLKRDET